MATRVCLFSLSRMSRAPKENKGNVRVVLVGQCVVAKQPPLGNKESET